jgi:hypothetical protein
VFPGIFLYLHPYRILCTSNHDQFDCVPLGLAALPDTSLRMPRPDVVRGDEEQAKLLCHSGFRETSRNFTYLCWVLPRDDEPEPADPSAEASPSRPGGGSEPESAFPTGRRLAVTGSLAGPTVATVWTVATAVRQSTGLTAIGKAGRARSGWPPFFLRRASQLRQPRRPVKRSRAGLGTLGSDRLGRIRRSAPAVRSAQTVVGVRRPGRGPRRRFRRDRSFVGVDSVFGHVTIE